MHKLFSELQRCPDKALPLFLCLMSMGSSASFLPSLLQESALAAAGVISILQLAARSAASPSLRGLGLDPGRAGRAPAAERRRFILPSPVISSEIKSGEKTRDLWKFPACRLGTRACSLPHPDPKAEPGAAGRAEARCQFLIKLGPRREPRSASPAPDDNGGEAAAGRTSRYM